MRRFRAGQRKDQANLRVFREPADFRFIQMNPRAWCNFIVVDCDHEDALERFLHPSVPAPHWIIPNPVNGHAQVGWAIDPVKLTGKGVSEDAIRFLEAVKHSLRVLVDGDELFTGYLARNPAAAALPADGVLWGPRAEVYGLRELKAHMVSYVDPFEPEAESAWQPWPAFSQRKVHRDPADGRNNHLFYATRRHLWELGAPPTDEASIAYARRLNAQLVDPLPERELLDLSRSAVRQVQQGKGRPGAGGHGGKSPYLQEQGRKGGLARTAEKIGAAMSNLAIAQAARATAADALKALAFALLATGLAIVDVAQQVGRSIRTIQRWVQRAETGDTCEATGSGAPAAPEPLPPEEEPMPEPDDTEQAREELDQQYAELREAHGITPNPELHDYLLDRGWICATAGIWLWPESLDDTRPEGVWSATVILHTDTIELGLAGTPVVETYLFDDLDDLDRDLPQWEALTVMTDEQLATLENAEQE